MQYCAVLCSTFRPIIGSSNSKHVRPIILCSKRSPFSSSDTGWFYYRSESTTQRFMFTLVNEQRFIMKNNCFQVYFPVENRLKHLEILTTSMINQSGVLPNSIGIQVATNASGGATAEEGWGGVMEVLGHHQRTIHGRPP